MLVRTELMISRFLVPSIACSEGSGVSVASLLLMLLVTALAMANMLQRNRVPGEQTLSGRAGAQCSDERAEESFIRHCTTREPGDVFTGSSNGA